VNASNGHQYYAPTRELFVYLALGRLRTAAVLARFDEVYPANGVVPRLEKGRKAGPDPTVYPGEARRAKTDKTISESKQAEDQKAYWKLKT
jgi:hypothetical protein